MNFVTCSGVAHQSFLVSSSCRSELFWWLMVCSMETCTCSGQTRFEDHRRGVKREAGLSMGQRGRERTAGGFWRERQARWPPC